MICGIGVDTVEIERFALWHSYQPTTLLRIFSRNEIDYCLEKKNKSAERCAARFAAREALYKALSYAYPNTKIPFLTLCAHTTISKINARPYLIFDWRCMIGVDDNAIPVIHLSWSHSRTHATAFVVLETK